MVFLGSRAGCHRQRGRHPAYCRTAVAVGARCDLGDRGDFALGALGLANPRRFGWALRSVAAVIVAAGVAYFISELVAWRNGKPIGAFGRRSGTSLWNSGLFLLVFGLPALRYLLAGRSDTAVDVIAAPDAVDEANRVSFHGVSQSDESRTVRHD